MDSGGGLLGDSAQLSDDASPELGVLGDLFSKETEQLLFVLSLDSFWVREDLVLLVLLLPLGSLDDHHSGITTIIDDDVWPLAVWPDQGVVGQLPVLGEVFSLPGENLGGVGLGDGGSGVVLSRVDVAGAPSDIGSEFLEGLDEDGGLDGHVEGSGDSGSLEDLGISVFGSARHESWHFDLSKVNFLSSPFVERLVLDPTSVESGFSLDVAFHWKLYRRLIEKEIFFFFNKKKIIFNFNFFVGVSPNINSLFTL